MYKRQVGGALILQNAVSNKYNRVINREGLNSLQALMRRPFNGTPVAITKTTTMKTILGWVQSGVCSLDWALMEYMELVETEIDGVRTAVGPLFEMLHIYMVLARLCKTHTYPVWGMTMLRQIRSTGPMRAPCFRGLSLGHFMLKVYWVLFCCVPGTLAAPCLTCYGFQPGCTFETNGKWRVQL